MNLEQIKEWLQAGQTDEVESVWMEAGEADAVDPELAAAVLSAVVETGNEDLADTLGWTLLEERKDRDDPATVLELAKALSLAMPLSAELRQQALDLYRQVYGDKEAFDGLVAASELMNAPTPRRAFATLDLCLALEDGCYVANRFRNQVAQVVRFDPTLREYELEDLADGLFTLDPRRLADEFEQIDETDFRVLSHRDPERLKELFLAEPATVLVGVCQSHEGRIDSVELKELLVPRYIESGQWSKWWSKARTAAKRSEKLTVEGRNPLFLVYHPEGLSLEDELASDVETARTPQETLDLLRRYAREARQRKVETDAGFAGGLAERLAEQAQTYRRERPADALVAALGIEAAEGMGFGRPEGSYPSPTDVLSEAGNPAATVAALEDEALWPAALAALAGIDTGGEHLEKLLPLAPARQLDRIAGLLRAAGREDALAGAAQRALADPLEHLDLLIWLWSDPAEPVPDTPPKIELLTRMLKAMHDLDIDMQMAEGRDRKEIQRRLRTAIAARDLAGFREVVAGIDEAMASIVRSRIERTDGLAETVRADMMQILREQFYGLFLKQKVLPWEDENTLYTTEEGLHRYEAELKELVEVTIPANSRAIGAAADLGDLSENSEWQFAVEERRKLQQRQAKMQDELTKARVLYPQEVETDVVNIGTKVTLRRADGESELEVSILGPWDSDLARRRYSYLTAMARALLGKAEGDTASLKIEGNEADYTIAAIAIAEF